LSLTEKQKKSSGFRGKRSDKIDERIERHGFVLRSGKNGM
jgi:hypothetical protein